jgi:hypothetical protein
LVKRAEWCVAEAFHVCVEVAEFTGDPEPLALSVRQASHDSRYRVVFEVIHWSSFLVFA